MLSSWGPLPTMATMIAPGVMQLKFARNNTDSNFRVAFFSKCAQPTGTSTPCFANAEGAQGSLLVLPTTQPCAKSQKRFLTPLSSLDHRTFTTSGGPT